MCIRAFWLFVLPYWMLCAGCVFSTDYPSDWPQRITTDEHDGCSDISGTFREPGKWASEGNDFSLTQYLMDLEATPDFFTISHESSDTIVLIASTQTEAVENKAVYSHSSGDYTCDGGVIWISKTGMMEPDGDIGVIIARVKETFGFSKTEDGSLLAEHHGTGGGVMLLFGFIPIPSAAAGNDYALWKSMELDGQPD